MVADTLLGKTLSHSPVKVINNSGLSPIVLICEHASDYIPDTLGDLGLSKADRQSHAVWDIGARDLSRALSKKLDAVLIEGCISRVVYDCNRPYNAPSAFPTRSERINVPGNEGLGDAARHERTEAVYVPFRTTVQSVLNRRQSATTNPIVVTVHSFTPIFHGAQRAVEVGILHDDDPAFALAMMNSADRLPGRNIVLNEPYAQSDGVTHSLAIYGVANGLPNVMLEVRNDLLTNETEIEAMAEDLLVLLLPALRAIFAREQDAQEKDNICPPN